MFVQEYLNNRFCLVTKAKVLMYTIKNMSQIDELGVSIATFLH